MLECADFTSLHSDMKLDTLRAVGGYIAHRYRQIEDYFTDGSFVIKFYPFLMHPCVRHSYRNSVRLFAILSIFCGLYAFFAELISILFSEASLSAYTKHTTIELLLAPNSVVDDQKSMLSPLSYTMQVVYLLQGTLFLLIYLIAVTAITSRRLRLLGVITALLFTVGTLLISSSQGGQYTVGGLHNLGFGITFIMANMMMFLTGCAIEYPQLHKFKWYSIIAGIIGIGAMTTPIFLETEYTPLLERIGIYLFQIWEIALGFAVLRQFQRIGSV